MNENHLIEVWLLLDPTIMVYFEWNIYRYLSVFEVRVINPSLKNTFGIWYRYSLQTIKPSAKNHLVSLEHLLNVISEDNYIILIKSFLFLVFISSEKIGFDNSSLNLFFKIWKIVFNLCSQTDLCNWPKKAIIYLCLWVSDCVMRSQSIKKYLVLGKLKIQFIWSNFPQNTRKN